MVIGELHQERGGRLGEAVVERAALGDVDLPDPVEPGAGLGGLRGPLADHQRGDGVAHLAGGRERPGRHVVEHAVLLFGDQQNRHRITPVSRSLPTSSPTEATLAPPWRAGGSTVFSTVRRGVTSTPKSSGVLASTGFFLAFMMLGSDA